MSSERDDARIDPGGMVLVVGPSGAGKDALISGARSRLQSDPTFVFARRVITRPAHAAEDHTPMSVAEFAEAERQRAFALSWLAHGVRYGIPADVDSDVRSGRLVVVNVSRAIIAEARGRYVRAPVVLVDCAIEIRAERLAMRGRERAEEILSRLRRTVDGFDRDAAAFTVDNGGPLDVGVKRFVAVLEAIAAAAAQQR